MNLHKNVKLNLQKASLKRRTIKLRFSQRHGKMAYYIANTHRRIPTVFEIGDLLLISRHVIINVTSISVCNQARLAIF